MKSFSAGVNKVIKTINALMLKLFLNIYYENQRYGFKSITTIVTIVIIIIILIVTVNCNVCEHQCPQQQQQQQQLKNTHNSPYTQQFIMTSVTQTMTLEDDQ